jgi:zinc/manganese transport system ATP-binding protein
MPKTDSRTIVSANNLSAGFGQKLLWQSASFKIYKGEFVGVLGPNGAGKTSLFRLLLGLNRPRSGKLEVFGAIPSRGNPRIGYVPQRRPVDEEMHIEASEFVRLGIHGSRWGFCLPPSARSEREQALAALELVDALALSHRPLGKLSGGELQRVFLAQALVGKPELLLLDEPLANLDIRRENELVRLVCEVAKSERVAVMLIAHDINPLLPYVDRIVYVVNGRIATGKLDEIITSQGLSALYDAPVEVLHDSRGRIAVLGTEEAAHHE